MVVRDTTEFDLDLFDQLIAEEEAKLEPKHRASIDYRKTAERYKVKAIPTTFLISPDGKVLVTHTGFDAKHAPEFEAQIAEALPR